jgi:hypothetical protein
MLTQLWETPFTVVLHACNDDAVTPAANHPMLIEQQVPPQATDGLDGLTAAVGLHLLVTPQVLGIVVIAQNGIDAFLGLDTAEQAATGVNLL